MFKRVSEADALLKKDSPVLALSKLETLDISMSRFMGKAYFTLDSCTLDPVDSVRARLEEICGKRKISLEWTFEFEWGWPEDGRV